MTPKKLGRYEVLSELGKGAMGLVFLGRDPIIGRELALKTFRVGLSAKDAELEQFRARFLREAQSAGRLNHPNIVTIHDVVVDGDDFVIAMEYIQGQDLKHLMQRQTERLDLRFVLEVVAQIAEGLDYAHAKGVVHRDIKPANIIITRPDKEKRDKFLAKITDFGIARVDASNLTVEGQLLGTPNYMAPEQIQGKEVDHRADLFSLGVMFYEMLTGKKPFAGENLTVVTHRIVYDAFTPPDQLVSGLPPRVAEILGKALQKDANQRYGRGGEFARDLRGVLAPETPQPRSEPTTASFLRDDPSLVAYPAGAPPTQFAAGGTLHGGTLGPGAPTMGSMPGSLPGTSPGSMSPGSMSPPPGSLGLPSSGAFHPSALHPGTGSAPGVAAAGYGSSTYGSSSYGAGSYGPAYPPRPPAPAAEPKKNWTWIAVGGAVLLAIGSALYFLNQKQPAPATPPQATQQASASEAIDLMNKGKAALAGGQAAQAFELFDRAVLIDDGNQELRRLREQAQRMMLDQSNARDETAMRDRLARVDAAMASRDYDLALTIVNGVLAIDPQNARALELKTEVDAARQRKQDEDRRIRDRLSTTTGVVTTPTPTPTAAPARPPAADATLMVDFQSQASEGIVNLYIGSKIIWEKTFDFGKNGIFRKSKGTGGFQESVKITSGEVKFKAYVSSQVNGQPVTSSRDLTATIAADANHRLRILVGENGSLDLAFD